MPRRSSRLARRRDPFLDVLDHVHRRRPPEPGQQRARQRVQVSGGCSASFNVPVESGIVRLKGDHKLGHLAVALESPEALAHTAACSPDPSFFLPADHVPLPSRRIFRACTEPAPNRDS